MLYQSYHAPQTIEEALAFLTPANGQQIRLIAGGTDLMVQLRERILNTDVLVDISGIAELKRIWVEDEQLHIGAAVSYTQLIESELVVSHAYLLAEASKQIGAPQIQHMGTVGGNLANASPAGDTLPCLYVLDARVTLTSKAGERQVPVSDFMIGVRKTVLQPDEIISRISFNVLPKNAGSAFVKLGLRRSQAISVVDAAAVLTVESGIISHARVALGSVAPTIVRGTSAEKILVGQPPSEELFERAAEGARQDISPITDIRGSQTYRLHVAQPLVKEALNKAMSRLSQIRAE